MAYKINVLTVDGSLVIHEHKLAPKLETLQRLVGGYIEVVPLLQEYNGKPCVAYCNEEGKLNGMAVNVSATKLWHLALKENDRIIDDVLVGDVVIITADTASEIEEL